MLRSLDFLGLFADFKGATISRFPRTSYGVHGRLQFERTLVLVTLDRYKLHQALY